MPRPPNPTTPEAAAITEALEAKGVGSRARVADALELTPGAVSQYASGNRPVPWDRAEALALELGRPATLISAEYRRIVERFPSSQPAIPDAKILSLAEGLVRIKEKEVGFYDDIGDRAEQLVQAYALLVKWDCAIPRREQTAFMKGHTGGAKNAGRGGERTG